MLKRVGLLGAALLCSTVVFAGMADAQSLRFNYNTYNDDDYYYPGPEYIPRRYYFWNPPPRRAYRYDPDYYDDDDDDYAYDPDFYQPEYVPPRKRKAYSKPQQKSAKKKPAVMSCAKAGQIVSGYGFNGVKTVNCKGQIYAFNATRDGKPFAIKLNSVSGELTEVKKVK